MRNYDTDLGRQRDPGGRTQLSSLDLRQSGFEVLQQLDRINN